MFLREYSEHEKNYLGNIIYIIMHHSCKEDWIKHVPTLEINENVKMVKDKTSRRVGNSSEDSQCKRALYSDSKIQV